MKASKPLRVRGVRPDSFASYDALDVSDLHYVHINHGENLAISRPSINGIEDLPDQYRGACAATTASPAVT